MPLIVNCEKAQGVISEESGAKGLLYRQIFDKSQCVLGATYNDVAPGGNTKDHSHAGVHLTYIVKGEGELVSGDQGTRIISEGELIYIPPHEPHCFRNTGDTLLVLLGIQE